MHVPKSIPALADIVGVKSIKKTVAFIVSVRDSEHKMMAQITETTKINAGHGT